MKSLDEMKQSYSEILDKYDNHTNPAPKPDQSNLSYYWYHFNWLHFFGNNGRLRSRRFRDFLQADTSDTALGFLKNLYVHAFSEYIQSSKSHLAMQTLDFVAKETGIRLGEMDIHYIQALPPFAALFSASESYSMFYRRLGNELGLRNDDVLSHNVESVEKITRQI